MSVNSRREGRSKGENKRYRGLGFFKYNFFFPLFPSCARLDLGRESSSLPSSSCPGPPEGELKDVPQAVTGGEGAAWPGKMRSSLPGSGLGAGALDSDG